MELSTRELTTSIESLKSRGLTVVESTKNAGVEFFGRTQKITAEWLVEGEKKVLTSVLDALRELETRIEKRLELLGGDFAAVEAASEAAALPIPDYDAQTAKDIVAELSRLSADAAKAILEYEKAHKARATVIRAAEQRLVA
ncbi:MAG: hypothetical protein GXY23_11475 [Myxococcales bacterium]|nr:hypothetical protein [Myxococcales bacterium]